MNIVTELFRWWVVDEVTGERQLTTFKLSRENAQRAFPGAKPDLESREVSGFLPPEEPSVSFPVADMAGPDLTNFAK